MLRIQEIYSFQGRGLNYKQSVIRTSGNENLMQKHAKQGIRWNVLFYYDSMITNTFKVIINIALLSLVRSEDKSRNLKK